MSEWSVSTASLALPRMGSCWAGKWAGHSDRSQYQLRWQATHITRCSSHLYITESKFLGTRQGRESAIGGAEGQMEEI